MSITSLSPEKDLCRCCHAEGSFDDLAQPYFHDGREEVYSDMIKDSFNIEVSPVPGQLCVVTYKICKHCIQRVRDAFLFRKQVQTCEEKFMDLYNRSISQLKGLGLKTVVKEELSETIDMKDDYSPIHDYEDEDYDMKYEIEAEPSPTIRESKKTKAKSKTTVKTKTKKVKEGKTRKIKEEGRGEDAPEASETKKPKGKEEEFHLTTEADGTPTYTCKVCERTFKKRNHFSQHHRHVHLKLRPKFRSCYLCKEKVPGHMRSFHMEEAHGRPAPRCGACGKKFAYPFQVLQHQKNFHMGEKKFACANCNLTFSTKSKLTRHETVHSPSRPFKCAFCDAAFKWKKNLQTHIMMHLDDRRHVCTVCEVAFVQQSSLKWHIKKQHPDMV
ncbi:uncharacterized protein [Epargyreus clarus]|uniref:uncharacterized protein isoform X3 n=1 Tax=Epargyreus clarus TaxID=520877 RepID=UPI003C2F70FA